MKDLDFYEKVFKEKLWVFLIFILILILFFCFSIKN